MAKFTFDTTTVGEMLGYGPTNKLFFDLVPEAKDYADMLELGKGLTISEAMPFIEMIAGELGIDNVEERVADFKEKLEAIE